MDMKKLAGDKAAEYVKDGMVVGLGTGSTAYHMVNAVGEMVKNGLKIQAIPTSKATEAQARELGIPLLTIDELDHVDLAIDGVDEIDPQFNAIKGGGGALYREKVVASMAKEVIWIMDESKLVEDVYKRQLEHPVSRRVAAGQAASARAEAERQLALGYLLLFDHLAPRARGLG